MTPLTLDEALAVVQNLAARSQRSVFNILGPLINPGQPAHILLGVYSRPLVTAMSGALEELHQTAGLVAHGVIQPLTGAASGNRGVRLRLLEAGSLRASGAA